jgi:hypothetical protein
MLRFLVDKKLKRTRSLFLPATNPNCDTTIQINQKGNQKLQRFEIQTVASVLHSVLHYSISR